MKTRTYRVTVTKVDGSAEFFKFFAQFPASALGAFREAHPALYGECALIVVEEV